MDSAIRERIKKYIEDDLTVQKIKITDDDSLFGAGIIDSLGHIKLICFLEKEFNISINMEEITLDNFDTINKITNFIRKKLADK